MKYQVCFERKLEIFRENITVLWLHIKSRLSHPKNIKVKWFGSSLVFI